MLGARFLIFDLGAPGVPPKTPQNRSKSKFIEIHRVWCLSIRLHAYYSYETFVWRLDPMGAPGSPQGCPKWGPHPTFTKTPFVWYQSICLDAYYSYETFFWRFDPVGPPEPPRAPQMGSPPDFNQNAFCMVSIDSHTHHL